jgi:predicted transcriptional regulator
MQITVTVSDVIVREAGARGMAVSEFVESLIDKGMADADRGKERPMLSSAMERIRALRTPASEVKR